jgi:nucleoside triphosphate pyrophosphatase
MLSSRLLKYNVILASSSPRRKILLEELGIRFTVKTKPVDESYPLDYPVEKIARYVSEIKAAAFRSKEMEPNTLLITADTVVALGSTVLGKPASLDEAKLILQKLSGCRHQVITGVTLRTTTKRHSFSVYTEVYFKKLSVKEINYYVDNFKPLDKAGAYGIQEWIGHVAIEKIEGSYFNVMGLPTHRLYEELIKFIDGNEEKDNYLDLDL